MNIFNNHTLYYDHHNMLTPFYCEFLTKPPLSLPCVVSKSVGSGMMYVSNSHPYATAKG